MRDSAFKYIFRFCCDPGFNDELEIKELMKYVDAAEIDDVAVFANVQEINTGHMSFDEQDVYIDLMRKLTKQLAEKGITLSVNQWHSVMHADLGKSLRNDQNFRLMVDVEGNESSLCVCPLCENWQDYISEIYARYAKLEPSILWVEDDFRLHNHMPLVWGGCFCEKHMDIYSERAGKKLDREEFIRGVLQAGDVHPYRKIWLDVSRETMLSAAEKIGNAIRVVSDKAKVGLMSSVPHIHAAEGRDWHAILKKLANGTVPVNRIHLPGYQESTPSGYLNNFNMVSMLTRAMIPSETEVYPELENFPYSLFSKSKKFTKFQFLSSLVLNLSGMTIDLYDLNGNGIVWGDGYQDMLKEIKPFLNNLNGEGVFLNKRNGVHVLYSEKSSYTLKTEQGKKMEELYPREVFFAALLPAMGVPYQYSDDFSVKNKIVAVSGQVFRNESKEKITKLFENNFVILSGDAAFTLCDMGLGHLAGIENAEWAKQDSGVFTYEQVTNGKVYYEKENARASAVMSCSDVLDVKYSNDVNKDEYTAFYNAFRERTLSGEVVVNEKVMIYPFGRFEESLSIPPMLMSSLRQEVLHDILENADSDLPIIKNAPYLEPYMFCSDEVNYLYLINGSSDNVEKIEISGVDLPEEIEIIISCTNKKEIVNRNKNNGSYIIEKEIPSMETALLTWRKA